MKKLIMGMMVVAGAFAAFCDNTAAQPVDTNPLIVSQNLFGSIMVESRSEFTMVAVPFEGFASQFEDSSFGTTTPNAILARDVIAVENLATNDTMSIYYPLAEDKKEEFHNYIARKGRVKVGKEYYEYMEWLASMWFDEETMTSNKYPEPDARLVETGSGVFVGRDKGNLTQDGFSIYAYGQVPMGYDYTQTIVLKEGKTILSGPGELAYDQLDLNAFTWEGVSKSDLTGTERSGSRVFDRYGVNKVLMVDTISENADCITTYTTDYAVNTLSNRKDYYRYNGKWVRMINETVASLDDDAFIPAGQSFWYLRNTTGNASMKWTAPTTASSNTSD